MLGYIYVWRCLLDNKVYVGQSVSPKGRKYGHLDRYRRGHNHPLYDAMRCHGLNNFEYSILEELGEVDQDTLDSVETSWIALLRSTNRKFGYNLESGGRGKGKISEETRAKLCAYQSTRPPYSEETKRNWSRYRRQQWSKDLVDQILELSKRGHSNREIGRRLGLSSNRARIAAIVRKGHDDIE